MFDKNNKNEEKASRGQTRDLEEENKKLYSQLTNKNQDYFFQLNNRLDELSYEKDKKEAVLNKLLTETVEFQKDAITARRMYGTVTEQANKIIEFGLDDYKETTDEKATKHLYLEGALLLGGMFSIVDGVNAWRSSVIEVTLLQFVINFLLGGLVFLNLIKYRPEAGKQKGRYRYLLITIATMLSWLLVVAGVKLIPSSTFNPVLSKIFVIIIGILAILLRWVLKKKNYIKGNFF